jgi:predicted Fe-Mo cluster-binding NifX family protein
MKVAIPTTHPGGLDASLNAHFGRCETVTLVTIEQNEIKNTEVLTPQGEHSCGSLPALFAQNGADTCIVGGIGGRPFMILQQLGIKTYTVNQNMLDRPIKEIVTFFQENQLPELVSGTCQHHDH